MSFKLMTKFSTRMLLRPTFNSDSAKSTAGFTLIELLVVITIIGVLLAISASGFMGALTGSQLTRAGEQLAGDLSEAQERAISTGRPVEVRLYRMIDSSSPDDGANPGGAYSAVVLLEYYQAGQTDPRSDLQTGLTTLTVPLALARSGIRTFPQGIAMAENPELSSLLDSANLTEMDESSASIQTFMRSASGYKPFKIANGSSKYRSIVFYPEGTSLNSTQNCFLTLTSSSDSLVGKAAADVKNYFTVQIDPVTGRVNIYRP